MKTTKLLITLCVFLATFLVGGIALAKVLGEFDRLEAPKLTVKIEGNKVTLSWNKVNGATDYVVRFTQYPYIDLESMKTIHVGDKTNAVYELSQGSRYHVAVQACCGSRENY